MKPKNSSKAPVPEVVIIAAKEAENEVQEDLMEKLQPLLDFLSPKDRQMILATAAKLASKVSGEPVPPDGESGLQALAFALTALNAFRESQGMDPVTLETPAVTLVSMMDEAMSDPAFSDFMKSEIPEEEEEEEPETEESMVESEGPKDLMGRRATFMGAM
jgi:hypothetical protein